jgi:hypothetical protein
MILPDDYKHKKKSIDKRQDRQIKKLKKDVERIKNAIEWKTKDVLTTAVSITTAGYANYPMFQIARGEGNDQRNGDSVSLRYGTLHITLKKSTSDGSNMFRVLLVQTPSATPATLSDILEYGDYTTDGDLVFSSPYKVKSTNSEQTYKRFFDKVYEIPADKDKIVDKIKIKLPKKGKKLEFVGNGSVAPNNYNLSLLVISDSSVAPHPNVAYIMRWKYIDL